MKQKILYTISILLMAALFLAGCKKDLSLKSKKLAVDSTKTGDTTVSTLGYGSYNYLTADTGGNVYALNLNFNGDTIFKYDKTGHKSPFYTPPVTMDDDTIVKNILTCLATDSLGNVYTVNNVLSNAVFNTSVIKISPTGSASTIYSNFTTGSNGPPVYKISVDGNGFVYFSDSQGVKKIRSDGSTLLLASGISTYAMDRKGDIFYAVASTSGQTGIDELSNGGLVVGITGPGSSQTIAAVNPVSLTTDRNGNVYVAGLYDNNTRSAIIKLKYTTYNYLNPVWPNASLLLQNVLGQVDGPIAGAEISIPFSLAADGAGNLYFSEQSAPLPDIRKITF